MIAALESERGHEVALCRIRVQTSDWFGAPPSGPAGSVCTFVSVSPAGATLAAESHGVGEDRVGLHGTAGQNSCAVFQFVIGAPSLFQVGWSEFILDDAVLIIKHRQMSSLSSTWSLLVK